MVILGLRFNYYDISVVFDITVSTQLSSYCYINNLKALHGPTRSIKTRFESVIVS